MWIIHFISGVCLLSFRVRLLIVALERADLLALVCYVLLLVCYFPIGILGQVWYLIVSIPDLCPLSYFEHIQSTSRSQKMYI